LSTTFNDFLEVLKDSVFEENPVDVKTFVESPNYLGQPQLSEIQYNIVEAMSQIYYKKDLKIVHEKEIINLMSVCFAIEKSLKTKKWEKVEYTSYKK
jgi:hypothetical protein